MNACTTGRRWDYIYSGPLQILPESLIILRSQAAKITALQGAYRKAEAQHPRENAPKAGQIRSLGLLGKEDDSKAVMDSK